MGDILKIEYDMEDMAVGIKEAIMKELSKDLAEEIKSELKAEMREKLFGKVKESIENNTYELVQSMINDIYNTEKVVIGGGWEEEAKEFTLKEYVIEQVKEVIVNNKCDGKGYGSTSFQEWFTKKCVDPDIQKIIEKEITNIRNDVNYKVKNMFDTSTKQMLSETVLNVLMANDTYKKIEGSIASIANK